MKGVVNNALEQINGLIIKIGEMKMDMSDLNESNIAFVASPPCHKYKCFTKMKLYGNHWRVADDPSNALVNYDRSVAIFDANEQAT